MGSHARSLAGVTAWKLLTGLCIRRPTVITPSLTPIQKQMSDMLDMVEFERSHLSAHELRAKTEAARLRQTQGKGQKAIRNTNSEESLVTAHEQELLWQAEEIKFRPAERLTSKLLRRNGKKFCHYPFSYYLYPHSAS
ncbi:unnamed protein product [Echinostoma caproni]|uniref:MRP-L46 domain-containing protein n=1 Tax=Echinostoma caproni TaxID=27848 RepID=A0A183B8M2_9TREM|nr:unnamed protein product [Echinostoma caproni]